MKKMIVALAMGVCMQVSHADLLVGWDFAGLSGITAGSVTSNVAATEMDETSTMLISRGSGLTPSSNSGGYAANNWALVAFDATDYFEFNAIADPGFSFNVSNVVFNIRRSSSGPTNMILRSSVDGFTADLNTFIAVANTTYNSPISLLGQASVTFRLYGYGATGAAGSMNLGGVGDDLVVQGTIVPEPGTLAFLSIGLMGLYGVRRRSKR